MAEPHGYGSFDYKVINENIKKILDDRSRLDNTIQLSMPFVKATTTLQLSQVFKQGYDGDVGFTLGLHAIDHDVKYEDMFSSQDNDLPLIGYTYGQDGATKRVYANSDTDEIVAKVFDRQSKLFTNTNFTRIPPPGIEQVSIGRNKNGLLASAQININVPSLVQLETLHKTFLVPGIGMVLEWGRKFAPGSTEELAEGDVTDYMFPWYDRDKLIALLKKLGANKVGLNDILKDYVYPTKGQYMWMFGRVANFTVNSNSDGAYKVTVKIVGPSEDSWAYSTKNTVIPPRDASTKFFCASKTNSIYSYFTENTVGQNFKTKLDDTLNPSKNSPWRKHVIKFDFGNKKGGEPKPDESKPVVSQNSFADTENAYFISWRFFVNEVLNGADHSVRSSVFGNALIDNEYELGKVGMLMPYAHGPTRQIRGDALADPTKYGYIDDPYESFVGMNPHLRSIDPSTMIIVNEEAVNFARNSKQYQLATSEKDIFRDTEKSLQFKSVGLFEKSTLAYAPDTKGKGFLSAGVWLNHKAVIESMISGETLMRGISNLLDRMNNATNRYWNLSLDVVEPEREFDSAYNYMVVDMNYRESSDKAVSKFIDNVHIFNKYVRVDEATGKLVGSELIENSVDLSLPKLMFTQIATLGLVGENDIKAALQKNDQTTDKQPDTPEAAIDPKISDPNDTLRRMFAITSLVAPSDDAQGPDLTIPPKKERQALLDAQKQCAGANTQVTAQAAGIGNRSETPIISPEIKSKSTEELQKQQKENKELLESALCKKCETCASPPPPTVPATTNPGINKKLSQLTIAEVQSVQKPRGTVLAVGKYQAIPSTFTSWVSAEKISPTAVFDSNLQEKLGDWLIVGKRPKVGKFVNGDPSISIEEAQLELAKEFASIPVPYRVTRPAGAGGRSDPGGVVEAGQSYYYGVAGNRAGASSARYQEALRTARQNKNVQSLKEFIARGEGNYDALNRGEAGDTATYSTAYYTALNQRGVNPATSDTKQCTDREYINASMIDDPGALPTVQRGKDACKKCNAAKLVDKQINSILPEKQKIEVFTRQFEGMQDVFKYIELFPDFMTAEITGTADGNVSNAFGASPGALAIKADLTMPGINGMRVGELFWMDRIPSFYKAFGAFQIMSIEDTIGLDGWKTKIHAQFNYLGTKWKTSMANKLDRERS